MDRSYFGYGITIRESVVATLSLWNTMDVYQNEAGDFTFLQFLLIEIAGGSEKLAANNLESKKKEFVQELFAVRVKGDVGRMSKFDKHVALVIDQFKRKIEANN